MMPSRLVRSFTIGPPEVFTEHPVLAENGTEAQWGIKGV
jgi:hypothetical protein